MRGPWSLIAMSWLLLLPRVAPDDEPVAVITEIRMGQGAVRVKPGGEEIGRAPLPLLALRAGDQVSAEGDARAVLVFTGGRGPQSVTAANSPFSVQAPGGALIAERLQGVVNDVLQFLSGKRKELAYLSLSARVIPDPSRVLLLSPRETRLFPGPVTFEWIGPERLRYRVRVLGPRGLVWEQANLPRRTLAYPATAPALRAGSAYAWELEPGGQAALRATFELLPASEAARVQSALAWLQASALPGYPRTTVALMRAGLLFQEGLHAEARRELLSAIAADADEPTLHLLLGQLYERIRLKEPAEDEFREAHILTTRKL